MLFVDGELGRVPAASGRSCLSASSFTVGSVASHDLPAGLGTVAADGLLGAYTTSSTEMYGTAELVEDRATAAAISNLIVPTGSATAATLGWASEQREDLSRSASPDRRRMMTEALPQWVGRLDLSRRVLRPASQEVVVTV